MAQIKDDAISPDVVAISDRLIGKIQPSDSEKQWIDANHKIRFWVSAEAPPYFYDKKQPVGLAIDYAKITCAVYKLNCEFKDQFSGSFSEAIPFIGTANGPDVFMTGRFLPERLKYVLYTNQYLFSPWVIITRTDSARIISLGDLSGKKIVGVKGFVVNGLVRKEVSDFEFIEKKTQHEALQAISSGVGDAYVADLVNATFMIAQYGFSNLTVAAPTNFPIQGESMMVRKDWPELVTLTNKVLDTLTEQEKQSLKEKWFSVRFDYGYWRIVAIYASIFGVMLLLGLILFWSWNKRLKKEKAQIQMLLDERDFMVGSLLKANKTAATGALSASIAHELNQPLGASNLNIQFLKMKLENGALNPELGKEILDSLEQDNTRAATIVKSLRSIFTDGESNTQAVQLGDLVSSVLEIVKPELKSKNIQIQLRVDDDLVIMVNPSEIEQVILNLLNNAIQALAKSGTLQHRIALEATKVGQSVRLSVSDNGPGVPVEFKPQLFELLSTTKQTGMGLGLWLCKHIVTRYSGSIHHEDLVGGGTRFVIELPSAAYS
ncbi:ATP-binding protein [Polynucleobacter sp. MG-5-Ahmo-C2]|uniref:ATP-binding protein n=1 Tax=Polynucleobacter sp. MG-5-Ahmo-C2 TaxID=2081051 RepID=UPI001BFE379D|nr:transporter substrate-binding domain-containing protein [Polynucleobacter sp. MG-5-Ahmo-C2]